MQRVLPLGEEVQDRRPMLPVAHQMLGQGFAETEVDPNILAVNLEPIRSGMRKITSDPRLGSLLPKQIVHKDEVGWNMEAGLIRRSGKDETGNKEDKFFFHLVSGMQWPDEERSKDVFEFLLACHKISLAARNIAISIAQEIDAMQVRQWPLPPSLVHAINSSYVVTRVLRYITPNAYTHFDRSAITVHWWASHPGLVIVDSAGKQHRVAESAWNRVAVFPGKKFGGFFKGKYGRGTLHGVRTTHCENDAGDDRYSLVSFIHAKLEPDAAKWIKANTKLMDSLEREHSL